MTHPLDIRHIHDHVPSPHRLAARVLPAALGTGLLVGAVAWQHQMSKGMATTGMRDVVPLGAYTVAYLTFVSIAAGSLTMATTGLVVPSGPAGSLIRPGLATALGGFAAAFLAFMVNLDRPSRVYDLVLHPNWSSPVVWSLYAVLFELVVAATLVLIHGASGRAGSRTVRVLALGGLVTAPVTAGATAGIFAFQTARPAWTGGLVLPLYLISAVVAGTAAVTLCPGRPQIAGSGNREWLASVLIAFLGIELFLTALGYLTAARTAAGQWAAMERQLPGGAWSWLFWVQWLVGGMVPLLLLALRATRRWHHGTEVAAALALCGVITSYVALVPGGLTSPLILLAPGVALGSGRAGTMSFQAVGFYQPTMTEYGILLGLLCAFLMVAATAFRRRDSAGATR